MGGWVDGWLGGLQALGCDSLGFEGEWKNTFSSLFFLLVFMEVFFLKSYFQFFVACHLLIFRETSYFYDMYVHYRSIFSNSLFFFMLWASFFFFIADVCFYMYYGYLYRNFFQIYLLCTNSLLSFCICGL